MRGTELTLDLQYDEAWETRLAEQPPRVLLATGASADKKAEITWRRLAPGHFQATTELDEGDLLRGVVQAGPHALSFGPVLVGHASEWAFEGARLDELRAASAQTGGKELLELADAWRSPPSRQFDDIRISLLLATLLAILADALITRTGWRLPAWAKARKRPQKSPSQAAAKAHQARLHHERPSIPAPPPALAATPEPPLGESQKSTRRHRFLRAKK